jgi:hypothetical protein
LEIEDILHAVTGLTFAQRASLRAGRAGPEVYLLGHEELSVRRLSLDAAVQFDPVHQC